MKPAEFGQTKDGEKVMLYTLSNQNRMKMGVINLGATIVTLEVLGKHGTLRDVVLGYDNIEDYQKNACYFGAVIGRNANRIKEARVVLDGITYELEQNDYENNLHSGLMGMHQKVWQTDFDENQQNQITFTCHSKDKEQGFPGNLTAKVTYKLTDNNELTIQYEAVTDKTTIANLTNHTYFNLNGHNNGDIKHHRMEIATDEYTPVADNQAIPTGIIAKTTETPMDFSVAKPIGQDIEAPFEQLCYTGGYDHNYALKADGTLKLAAKVWADQSDLLMEVYTDCVGVQFYSGNSIPTHLGKDGAHYKKHSGFCLETQYYPNAANEKNFVTPILAAGETYRSQTNYKFIIK
jgi:aldose 1-epimerase